MKKNLIHLMAILMVAVVSSGLVSCGSDDDDSVDTNPTSIIGMWVKSYEKETTSVLVNGSWVVSKEQEKNEAGKNALYFGIDGSYKKMYPDANGGWYEGTSSTYTVVGNALFIKDSSSSKTYTFSVINGNTLEIIETDVEGLEKEEELKRYVKMM